MTPDPKLVEALASVFASRAIWSIYHGSPVVEEWHRKRAREFIDTHRLVQLPEEPIGWVPVDEKRVAILGGVRKSRQDAEAYALPVHPIYIIPEATND